MIYIDPWVQNPKFPHQAVNYYVPDDADLVLVSHGHFDAAICAPDFIKASSKSSCKIVCNAEIKHYYKTEKKVEDQKIM